MRGKIFIYSDTQFCWLMRDNKRVLETIQHKLPMDLTHRLCKTDMINMIFGVMLSIRSFFTALAVEW